MNDKPIRVVHVVPNMHAAGLETFIMNMYRNIDRTKIQFDFLTHYPRKFFYDDEIEELGGHIFRLTFREDLNLFKYINDLDAFFGRNKYDVVHSHMASTAIFTLYFAKKYKIPVRIVHSHNTSTDASIKGQLKKLLLKNSTRFANVYFACGIDAGRFLFCKKKFTVIHNAINIKSFSDAVAFEDKYIKSLKLDDKFVLGHVGRFTLQKNHDFLIDLIKKYKDIDSKVRLLLVGEGELEEKIRCRVINEGLSEYVHFLGVQSDMPAIYKLFDVFLLPSLFEGLPVVGVECQAAGVITIFSDRVTKEVGITDYAHFVSIENGVEEWIKLLNKIKNKKNFNHEFQVKKIVDAGFEVTSQAADLLKVYQNEIQKNKEEK